MSVVRMRHTRALFLSLSLSLSLVLEVIEVIDLILDFTVPPHQIRRLWRHPGYAS